MTQLPEQKTWDNLRKRMRGQWKADRVETDTVGGFPDVVYTCRGKSGSFNVGDSRGISIITIGTTGFLELKFLDSFPKKQETIVKLHRFTLKQVNFALNTAYYGGKAFMFVQVGVELYLFKPDAMKEIFNGVNTLRFVALACGAWYGWKEFENDVNTFMGFIA